MTTADIITKVKLKLDEVSTLDTNDVIADTQISGLLDEGVKEILMKVPLHLIVPTAITASATAGTPNTLVLDKDYLRLHSFKGSAWNRTLTEVIPDESPKSVYKEFVSTRGSDTKPKLFLSRSGSNYVLQWFGTATVTTKNYVKAITASLLQDGTTGIDLTDVLAWQVAGNVLLIAGDEQAKACYAKVEEFIKANQ